VSALLIFGKYHIVSISKNVSNQQKAANGLWPCEVLQGFTHCSFELM